MLSNTQSFVVTVNAPDRPPHIVPIGDKVAVAGQPFQLVIKATDADQDPLNFSAIGLPPNATLTTNGIYGQRVLSWTPTSADVGKYGILVSVTDSGDGNPVNALGDQQLFTINVRTSNQAPVWVVGRRPDGHHEPDLVRATESRRSGRRYRDIFGSESAGRRKA
ncbi:MAG: Ig-like domain-containing protein [Bradyrhizobium sp.]